jgi:hypothetical protein
MELEEHIFPQTSLWYNGQPWTNMFVNYVEHVMYAKEYVTY